MTNWREVILDAAGPGDAWTRMFGALGEVARATPSPVDLHNKTTEPDRLLAEAAWDLWRDYPDAAVRTSQALRDWWSQPSGSGRAVLILDALSLRELPALLAGAAARKVEPTSVRVTGSEVPSDTDTFAKSLGVPSRSSLKNNGAPGGFAFASDGPFTAVLELNFQDCAASSVIPPQRDLFIWHTWLDTLMHVQAKSPDQVFKSASDALQSDGFWQLLDYLRTGRRLIITGDHGYAYSKLFAAEQDVTVVEALKAAFSASRCKPADKLWPLDLLPPVVQTHNEHLVVIGQRKWPIAGGFPFLCHGGLSLLEVAVPFVELPAR
jgi:hypothetical protein